MNDELLVLTGPHLHDDVARCGAAAGYRMVTGHPADCRHEWLRAGAVVVDGGALEALARATPPERPGVIVVAGPDDEPPWRAGLIVGAQGGFVLTSDESALVAALSGVRRPVRGAARVLAVVGGHGGAGASSLAAATALTAALDGPVLLMDADPIGAGLDLLLGAERRPGLRWGDITGQTGSIAGPALSAALPSAADGLKVLTRARDDGTALHPDTVLAVLDAARSHGDTVIADAGRATDAACAGVLDTADLVVVIAGASVPAVSATRRLVGRIGTRSETALVVRGPSPGGLTADEIARAVGLPLLTGIREQRGLARQSESGGLRLGARAPLATAATTVLDALAAKAGRR